MCPMVVGDVDLDAIALEQLGGLGRLQETVVPQMHQDQQSLLVPTDTESAIIVAEAADLAILRGHRLHRQAAPAPIVGLTVHDDASQARNIKQRRLRERDGDNHHEQQERWAKLVGKSHSGFSVMFGKMINSGAVLKTISTKTPSFWAWPVGSGCMTSTKVTPLDLRVCASKSGWALQ